MTINTKLALAVIVCLAIIAFLMVLSHKEAGFSPSQSFLDNQQFDNEEDASQDLPLDDTQTTDSIIMSSENNGQDALPPSNSSDSDEANLENVIGNYYIGLVYTPEGVLGGSDCYGEFIVLINNQNATNPSYDQLIDFLKRDKTDQFPYQYTISSVEFYYGTAESHIDLNHIQNIISGTSQPSDPQICADFAERLHNEAERVGIRCGYVVVGLTDYALGHALNAFQTIDRGLVYIDNTGISGYGPSNCDTTIDVQVGQQYIPVSLFPESGWSTTWESMGIITDIFITWDGEWH